jgi:hypothetical protein
VAGLDPGRIVEQSSHSDSIVKKPERCFDLQL